MQVMRHDISNLSTSHIDDSGWMQGPVDKTSGFRCAFVNPTQAPEEMLTDSHGS